MRSCAPMEGTLLEVLGNRQARRGDDAALDLHGHGAQVRLALGTLEYLVGPHPLADDRIVPGRHPYLPPPARSLDTPSSSGSTRKGFPLHSIIAPAFHC